MPSNRNPANDIKDEIAKIRRDTDAGLYDATDSDDVSDYFEEEQALLVEWLQNKFRIDDVENKYILPLSNAIFKEFRIDLSREDFVEMDRIRIGTESDIKCLLNAMYTRLPKHEVEPRPLN